MNVAAVLLAAGGSSRMGAVGPKQLLVFDGQPLVRRAAAAALGTGASPVIVVLGHAAEAVGEALAGLPVLVERNEAWHLGLGSSLKRGVARALAEVPTIEGVLVCLADQPFVTSGHLALLLRGFLGGRAVASVYGGAASVPAVIPSHMFPDVMALPDQAGAKALLAGAGRVPLADPSDIDTPEDLARLGGP